VKLRICQALLVLTIPLSALTFPFTANANYRSGYDMRAQLVEEALIRLAAEQVLLGDLDRESLTVSAQIEGTAPSSHREIANLEEEILQRKKRVEDLNERSTGHLTLAKKRQIETELRENYGAISAAIARKITLSNNIETLQARSKELAEKIKKSQKKISRLRAQISAAGDDQR